MNDLYAKAASAFLRGELNWPGDDWIIAYLDDTYVPDLALHEFASEVAGAVIAQAYLTGCAVLDDGVADADDATTLVVPVGQTVRYVAIWKDTGDVATSPLLLLLDEAEDFTPIGRPGTGAAIPCLFSSTSDRVFRI